MLLLLGSLHIGDSMKLPKRVHVDGDSYPVERMPPTKTYKGLDGIIYTEEGGRLILINMKRGARRKALTLLHELLHALMVPLKLDHSQEERIVTRLEEGLESTLEKNPTFFRDLITLLRHTRSR